MANGTQSAFLDSLYKMANDVETPQIEDSHDAFEPETLTPREIETRKLAALNGITRRMVTDSIPCDDEFKSDLDDEVIATVDRYFANRGGKLIQYFADTDNYATRVIKEAMEGEDITDDINEFVDMVIDLKDGEFQQISNEIKEDIKRSAQDDLEKIVNDVKDTGETGQEEDGMAMDPVQGDIPSQENPLNESVFHHYLMKHYFEAEVPNDIHQMLLTPMVETAFHYVRRILFDDGFGRRD